MIPGSASARNFLEHLAFVRCFVRVARVPPFVAQPSRRGSEATINRSAAASAKGPRLQRLRAALFLLEAIGDPEVLQAYAAVEADGDVFVSSATASASSAYSEEDKNYDEINAFTFVSRSVVNTVVIFLDQWLSWHCSTALRFGLYTTAAVGKEINAGRVKALGLELPDEPILHLLRVRDYSDGRLLPCVVCLVLAEYEDQYKGFPSIGHLETLRKWSDQSWLDFFSCVSWLFCEGDEGVAEQKVVDAVKGCRFYSEQHEGKEDIISAALVDEFDRKQLATDYAHRFVHASEVDVLFRKVASGEIRRTDPTWRAWDDIPAPTDVRSVGEKLTAVCPSLSTISLSRYQRRTAAGLLELEAHAQDKNILAMRFHIYDVCEAAVLVLAGRAASLSEAELDSELENLTQIAVARVAPRAVEYGYAHKTESFIRGLVLELFDSCFLALDRGNQ